jgi:hypothetical protein
MRLALMLMAALGVTREADARAAGANAALQYWQALVLLPHAETLTPPQKALLTDVRKASLSDINPAFIDLYRAALRCLHRGAAVGPCDWGLAASFHDEGSEAPLDHVHLARRLASVACLRARWSFAKGQASAAFEDLADALALGRHLSHDGTALGRVTNCAIEHSVIDITLDNLVSGQDPAALRAFRARLQVLPQPFMLPEVMQAGKADWVKNYCDMYTKPERAIECLQGAGPGAEQRIAQFHAALKAHKPEQLCAETATAFDQALRQASLPLQRRVDAFRDLLDSLRTANPVTRAMVTGMSQVCELDVRAACRFALFETGIAVAAEGTEVLVKFKDPYGGGPFEYRPTAGGFTLQSRATDESANPLILTFSTNTGKRDDIRKENKK